jgi:hypothetical protein
MFCTNAVLDEVIVCLLGLKVVELLFNLAAQEVPANYETVMNLCWLFADFGNGPMAAIAVRFQPAAIIVVRILAMPADKSLDPRTSFLNCILVAAIVPAEGERRGSGAFWQEP